MGGSPTINVMVYARFIGSTKINVKTFTLVTFWGFKIIKQYIKNKLDNMAV